MNKNMIFIVLCGLIVALPSTVSGAAARRAPVDSVKKAAAELKADKKIFDDLVSVWLTKNAGSERKTQRIKDLKNLLAVMQYNLFTLMQDHKFFSGKVKDWDEGCLKFYETAHRDASSAIVSAARYATKAISDAVNKFMELAPKNQPLYAAELLKAFMQEPKNIKLYNDRYQEVLKALKDLGITPEDYPSIMTMSWFDIYSSDCAAKNWECPICLEKFDKEKGCTKTPCGHVFHKTCLDGWKAKNPTCPMCRGKI